MHAYVRACVHAYVRTCTFMHTYVCCSVLQLLDKMESSLIPLISGIFEKGIMGESGKVEFKR